LSNSWGPLAKPAAPTQWLEEAIVEALSIRGLGLLADSWEQNPPFPGDAGFARFIRQYRADLIEKYRAAAPPGPDIAPAFVPPCVEDLGGLNRWPARSAVPVAEYLPLWQKSCAELGASGHLPSRLGKMLEPG
jgi:hypothetical protein